MRPLSGGLGADRVVEECGPGTMGASLRAVAHGGEIASIVFLTTENPGIDLFEMFGSWATFRPIPVGDREGLREVARAVAMAGIKPVIDRVFDFRRRAGSYAHLESGSHVGTVVIRSSAPATDAVMRSAL